MNLDIESPVSVLGKRIHNEDIQSNTGSKKKETNYIKNAKLNFNESDKELLIQYHNSKEDYKFSLIFLESETPDHGTED